MCEIDTDDFDPASVWSDTPRVARKAHECDGCGGIIPVGAHYCSHFSVHDGEPTSEKACFACWAMTEDFRNAHGSAYVPSYMAQALADCYSDNDRGSRWRLAHAGILKRWRVSPSGRRHLAKEHERAAKQRATMARIERDYPGASVIGDGVFAPRRDVIWFRFPGGANPAAWQNNEEVTLAPVDLAAWHEFERHCAAGRPR